MGGLFLFALCAKRNVRCDFVILDNTDERCSPLRTSPCRGRLPPLPKGRGTIGTMVEGFNDIPHARKPAPMLSPGAASSSPTGIVQTVQNE